MKTYSLLLLISLIAVLSCVPQDDVEDVLVGPVTANIRELAVHEQQLSDASTLFALKLFGQVAKSNQGTNLFISPYSVHQALSMTMNGNRGEVLEEFKRLLEVEDISLDAANKAARDLTAFLLQLDPQVKLAIANAIWYREGYQVKPPFKQAAREYYGAEIAPLDMLNPNSVNIINNWIAQQTNNLIKDMLDNIPANAVMYLVNAIYFKGDWTYNFPKANTKKERFFPQPGREVMVDMMDLGEPAAFHVFSTPEYGYIELPYSSGQFTMGIVYGQDGNTEALAERLTLENLTIWRNQGQERNMILKMPKFKFSYKIPDMAADLVDLGLEKPFDFHPDNFTELFSNPTDQLKISRVIHEALIEVDEKGTEAAAATIVEIIERVSMPPSGPWTLVLDKPFVFFIQEKHSGAILFMGKLENPLE
ncbi:Serpin (serine proteinase inhibitor) [Lunatimonas lonarensis]|uniref:Serpin (Serine proteinase inhibitor) n=1 Tax=Lunatimonas lonarensis TaxID=1232681 RepID=R7ZXZ0_9BACT|nr:serpin family protein [Lunatimonas lonarensis]EON78883.1 Serpin (serine proteinase inhibitor) [Lunatimonas lonarensis]